MTVPQAEDGATRVRALDGATLVKDGVILLVEVGATRVEVRQVPLGGATRSPLLVVLLVRLTVPSHPGSRPRRLLVAREQDLLHLPTVLHPQRPRTETGTDIATRSGIEGVTGTETETGIGNTVMTRIWPLLHAVAALDVRPLQQKVRAKIVKGVIGGVPQNPKPRRLIPEARWNLIHRAPQPLCQLQP